MLIDSHQHVFWHQRDDKGLIADMDENGIDLAWLLTWEIPPADHSDSYTGVLNPIHVQSDGKHPGIPLSDLVLARDRYPDRFVLGYCPNPANPEAVRLFQAACNIHGVRVCGEWKFRMHFDDPRCLNLFRKAGELGCPVVLHLDVPYLPGEDGQPVYQPRWYGGTVANLERALRACPQTNFIGHAPGFWREISGDADQLAASYPQVPSPVTPGGRLQRLLDNYPNLFADISAGSGLRALRRDPDHAVQFIERYADRLLFGRDYYGSDWMDFLTTLNLSQNARDKMFSENAQRLLGHVPAPA